MPARSEGVPPRMMVTRGRSCTVCFVRNRTLSLAVSYQECQKMGGKSGAVRGVSALGGDCAVVRRRKTLLRTSNPEFFGVRSSGKRLALTFTPARWSG